MTMIYNVSYAQNFEDIILWRALKDVPNGFYIDIGAQDPLDDSVSLLFYEKGWRGVHVEPTEQFAGKLRLARPEEEVVQAAIGGREGEIQFFQIGDSGMSTGDEAVARQHEVNGIQVVQVTVPCLSLSSLLQRYQDREIHWLKIDVEGMEAEVINSWLPSTVRPWIVVVESTVPGSTESTHSGWDPLVKKLGYKFVYFDGLNRFYVSNKHPELAQKFGPGPNVFDEFILAKSHQYFHKLSAEVGRLHNYVQEQEQERVVVAAALEAAKALAEQSNSALETAQREARNFAQVFASAQAELVFREEALKAQSAESENDARAKAELAAQKALLDAEVGRLHNYVQEQERERLAAATALEAAKALAEQSNLALETAQQEARKFAQEFASAQAELVLREEALKAQSAESENDAHAKAELAAQKALLDAEVGRLHNYVQEQERERLAAAAALEAAKALVEQSNLALETAQQEARKFAQESASAQAELVLREEALRVQSVESENYARAKAELAAQKARLEAELFEQKRRVRHFAEELAAARAKLGVRDDELKTVSAECEGRARALKELRAQLATLNAGAVEVMKLELTSANAALEVAKGEMALLSSKMRFIEERAAEQIRQLHDEKTGLQHGLSSLEHDLVARAEQVGQKERSIIDLYRQLDEAQQEIQRLRGAVASRDAEIVAVHASTSWHMTAPLRTVKRALRWLFRGISAWLLFKPGSRPRRIVVAVLRTCALEVRDRPRVKRFILAVVRPLPGMEKRLTRFVSEHKLPLGRQATGRFGVDWSVEPGKDALAEWSRLLK